jgi:restriction system protein
MTRWDQRQKRQAADARKKEAAERTTEAERATAKLGRLLAAIANASPVFEVSDGYGAEFGESKPNPPEYQNFPREPEPQDSWIEPESNFLDSLFPFWWRRKIRVARQQSEDEFQRRHSDWLIDCKEIQDANKALENAHQNSHAKWIKKKLAWEAHRDKARRELDAMHVSLKKGQAKGVEWLFQNVWEQLPLPRSIISGKYRVSFNEMTKTLIVDLDLPELDSLPKIKSVRYVAARGDIEEVMHKESVLRAAYDDFVYQIMLGVLYAFVVCDEEEVVTAFAVNGWVTYINRATGNQTTACIATLHCSIDELSKINMKAVDPKACFRSLKGIASPQVSSLTPVRPIMEIDRSDKRFVSSHEVMSVIREGTNIAAVGWEEFEHLIRELFEREFSANGGEVKVTQASRDGGVDAIAFDPDPIRGGKIVIQAKRYTNTVEVSAVRDLYGTVLAEGATKGILVTTSSFGADAHRFAKDKPLTLMDGNNLLYLLAKHGHVARIDLAEAKQLGNPLKR